MFRGPGSTLIAALAVLVLAAHVAGCATDLGRRTDVDGGSSIDTGTGTVDAFVGHDAFVAGDTYVPGDDAFVPADDAWTAPPVDAWSVPCPGADGTVIDLHSVTLYANPPSLADWPVTTSLTQVDFGADGVHVVFDKQDGASRWPDVVPPGWDGPLQYTLGMVECIDGQWYGSAVLEYWYGLPAMGGNVAEANQVATNWFYDAGRWGMLAGRQPVTGEIIGIFVAAGNLRNITTDDPAQSPVFERSNVVLMPFPDVSGASYSF